MRAEKFIGKGCFVGSLYKELPKVGNPKPMLQIDDEGWPISLSFGAHTICNAMQARLNASCKLKCLQIVPFNSKLSEIDALGSHYWVAGA